MQNENYDAAGNMDTVNTNSDYEVDLRLKTSINVNQLYSDTGTVFEIDESTAIFPQESDKPIINLDEEDEITPVNILFQDLSIGTNHEGGQYSDMTDSDEDLEPFEKLAKNMEDISGDDGVLKKMLYPGSGTDIPLNSTIKFHYNGYLEYADEPFDTSYFGKKPQKTSLRNPCVIEGLAIGLRTMRLKEKARFLIKPEYAYGKMGCPPRIPCDATVFFEVTIIEALDFDAADSFDTMGEEIKTKASFLERLDASMAYKRKGCHFYKMKDFSKAKDNYFKAIRAIDFSKVANEEECNKRSEMLTYLHSNLAQVYLDLKQYPKAITECRSSLMNSRPSDIDPDIIAKTHYRIGKAKTFLGDFESGKKHLKRAKKLKPNNMEIIDMLENLVKKEFQYKKTEKLMCKQMLSQHQTELSENIQSPEPDQTVQHSKEDEEFMEELRKRVENLIKDKEIRNITLPPNLNFAQSKYVSNLAEKKNLQVQELLVRQKKIVKLVKPLSFCQ